MRAFSNSYAAEDLKTLEALGKVPLEIGSFSEEIQDRIRQISSRCFPKFQEGLYDQVVELIKDFGLNFPQSPLFFPESPFQQDEKTFSEEDFRTPLKAVSSRASPPLVQTKRVRIDQLVDRSVSPECLFFLGSERDDV